MPLIVHVTAASAALLTIAVNVARCDASTVAYGGETVTLMPLVIVMIAEAVAVPAVAWIVTGFVDGKSTGAVYVATFAPPLELATIVPTFSLPPTIPFTSHMTWVPLAAHSAAVSIFV